MIRLSRAASHRTSIEILRRPPTRATLAPARLRTCDWTCALCSDNSFSRRLSPLIGIRNPNSIRLRARAAAPCSQVSTKRGASSVCPNLSQKTYRKGGCNSPSFVQKMTPGTHQKEKHKIETVKPEFVPCFRCQVPLPFPHHRFALRGSKGLAARGRPQDRIYPALLLPTVQHAWRGSMKFRLPLPVSREMAIAALEVAQRLLLAKA